MGEDPDRILRDQHGVAGRKLINITENGLRWNRDPEGEDLVETFQVEFEGSGWVLIQPSEGRVSSGIGGGGGGLLGALGG